MKKISPEWALRVGLGVMYLYSGLDLISHPSAWQWALPSWFKEIIVSALSLNGFLRIQGAVEVLVALVLLAWFLDRGWVRYAALFSVLEMAAILILAFLPFNSGNFLITFRDIGLLGGSLALFLILSTDSFRSPG